LYELNALLDGKLATGYGREKDVHPLKDNVARLRQLLGLPKTDNEKKE
jgi:hypothetical protein